MNYRIETIGDLLKVPAEKRAACFREIAYAMQLHELAFGEGAESTPIGSLTWADDGQTSISVSDSDGNVLLTMDVTTKNATGADLTPPTPDAPAWHDAPTCPGLWLCDEGDSDPYCFTTHRVTWPLNSMLLGDGERWYGPIPEDGK